MTKSIDSLASETRKTKEGSNKNELEQIVIVIEQGAVTGFKQRKVYPGLEGMNGEGI